MRDRIGILLMEEENGEIAVQLFSDPDRAKESFDNLMGTVGQKPQRATFIQVQYVDGKREISAWAKNLPVEDVPASERPDAWIVGKGPVWFDQERKP